MTPIRPQEQECGNKEGVRQAVWEYLEARDREDEILSRAGLIGPSTPRAVLVNAAQVFDDLTRLMEARGRRVSVVVTPAEVLRVG